MAQNEKSGSDLDIFEGLGKRSPSAPPNGTRSVPPPPPPAAARPSNKATLLGVAAPPNLGALMAAQAAQAAQPGPPPPSRLPPPPPGRASLPPVVTPQASRISSIPPPPAAPVAAKPANANAGAAVDMDWDEEDEATHIFDESSESTKIFDEEANEPTTIGDPLPEAPRPGMMVAPTAIPAAKPTLLGLTANPPLSSNPPPTRVLSRPPPPPPASGGVVGFPQARSSAPPSFPPPPAINPFPPAMATTPGLGLGGHPGARTMPPSSPASFGNVPIPRPAPVPDFQPSHRRAMEATAMVRPPQNRTMLFVGLGVLGVIAIGAALFLPSHPGRIVINVADSQGAGVNRVEIFVDGRKQCDTAPCTVDQVAAGPHDVKVLADGYDAPAVQTITVESRKDEIASFTLGSTAGTGIRVNGTQPGVKLYVDDKESGPLPQELRDLSAGDHVIKVAGSERYQPLEKHVTVERQKIQDLGTVTLKVLKGKATISLGTPGARVFLVSGADRRELPMLPISVDIDTTKSWSLEATKPGFMDYKQAIGFDDGQAERSYIVSLDPKTAGSMQQTPTYAPPSQPISAPAPRPVSHAAPAPAEPSGGGGGGGEGAEAFLNINSIPPSTAFLDGRSLGSTPKVHVSVKPGAHTVKFVDADDGLSKTVQVSVGAGETKGAVAKLN
ncbi:MAG TPA: PEGA domain-containing protein [Polyangiaceae bacterium]|nr:PEGA domain-containing protein [Polyangiaceae bacterium]